MDSFGSRQRSVRALVKSVLDLVVSYSTGNSSC
jgi:hypothetical protein